MIDRRAFLKAGGLSLVAVGGSSISGGPMFLARTALAAPGPGVLQRRKVLVSIFQRGAMDGLMAVPPLAEEELLKKYRPQLAMGGARNEGENRVLDLGNGFGLHPALSAFDALWQERRLAIVHQVGSPHTTRSHFDAQDYMETGTPGRKGTPSGWLNRVSGLLGHDSSPFRSVSMTSALPRSFYGPEPALAISRLEDFEMRLPGASGVAGVAGQGFEALYEETSQELLRHTASETFDAVKVLADLDPDRYRPSPGARYPRSPLGTALKQIAILIKSDVGLEVAFAESGGWDTHVQQGTTNGSFSRRASDLAQSITAFWRDLGQYQDDVVLTTMTEFGRTVKENGSGGTDHGHGSCLFVLGNQVEGGTVHGGIEGLHQDLLYERRDLPVSIDFRSVFSELAVAHLGVDAGQTLFPGWQGPTTPLLQRA